VRINAQPRLDARVRQLRESRDRYGDVIPDTTHFEDRLVGMFLHQRPAQERNHWDSDNCTLARRRFFVDQVRKGQAEITGENAHHLTRVLRVEVGQKFEITDNQRAWLASVETARKDLVRFNVIEEIAAGPELPSLTLYLALIKFERFEWAVEKATELGVTRIVPVETNRSEHGLFAGAQKRAERWRRISRESSEQSRR
jgi:16S rRNA (uracil1498-N3)-methyltransferase